MPTPADHYREAEKFGQEAADQLQETRHLIDHGNPTPTWIGRQNALVASLVALGQLHATLATAFDAHQEAGVEEWARSSWGAEAERSQA